MLSSEVANAINSKLNVRILPALSGISDKSFGVEFEKYLSLAKELGHSEEYLKMLSETIDFETYYIGNMESKSIVDDLFGKDDIDEFQKQIVDLIYPELKKLKEDALSSAIANSNFERLNSYELLTLDLDKAQVRQSYPSQGKVIGMLYSNYEDKPNFLGVLGISEDMVIFRLSDLAKSSVPRLLKELKAKYPHAMINGGGHDKAGTIKFLVCKKFEIIDFIKGEISK
jgi:RecJ-like exonuclease